MRAPGQCVTVRLTCPTVTDILTFSHPAHFTPDNNLIEFVFSEVSGNLSISTVSVKTAELSIPIQMLMIH